MLPLPASTSDTPALADVTPSSTSNAAHQSSRTRARRHGRNVALREAWLAEFGSLDSLGAADKEQDRVVLPCLRHPAGPIRLGALYARQAQGWLLCPTCDRETTTGQQRLEAGTQRRVAAVRKAHAQQWSRTVAPALHEACARLQLSLVAGTGGPSSSLELLCIRHTAEGPFSVRHPRKLLTVDESPCPHCVSERRMLQPWLRWAADPVLRETVYRVRRNGSAWARDGGYLYRIVDAASSRQYIGLTTLSLEVRWEGHLRDAGEKNRPLYLAMRERPADFSIEGIAFFRTREDLRQAEREWVRDEASIWPLGYNLSRGGESAGNSPDLDIREYAMRQDLTAAQVAHLLDWASWAPALELSRGGLYGRLVSNMPYDELVTKPTPKDRPLLLGTTMYSGTDEACESMGLDKRNLSPIASSAGVSVVEMLQFVHHLRTACGPWVLGGLVEGSLEALRKRVNVSPARLLRLSVESHESALQVLRRIAEADGERIAGELYLSREDACRARKIKLQTVLGRMGRNEETFEQAVLACAALARKRLHAHRTVSRPAVEFVFRGMTYANPTQAGMALGVASNTLSYWRGRFNDPREALEACLRSREGTFKRIKAPSGAPRMRIRNVEYSSLRHAAKELGLNVEYLKTTAARAGFCRESAVEYLLRRREGRSDLDVADIRMQLGLADFPVLDLPSPDEQTWLDSLHAALRCATRGYRLSRGLSQWLADQERGGVRTARLDEVWAQQRDTVLREVSARAQARNHRKAGKGATRDPLALSERDCAGLEGLAQLKALTGSIRVPAVEQWRSLRTWVQEVRRLHAKDALKEPLRVRLIEMQFDFSQVGDDWWLAFEALSRFAAQYGHCTPSSGDEGARHLYAWVTSQRQRRRMKGETAFSEAQLTALAELGFVWDMREKWWGRGVGLLREFIAAQGHGYVPEADVGQGAELRSFCASVRKARTQGYLDADRQAELETLGFVFQAGVKGQRPGVHYLKKMGRYPRTEQRAA